MKQEIKENYSLYLGDNIHWLKTLPSDSVDSVVTDPPYGLTSIVKRFGKSKSKNAQFGTDGVFKRSSKGFMGKEWDADVPSIEFWEEVYRILKPGGHILSFGGTRTYHRMATAIEEAGFEIRDQLQWIYGQGFPKSHNVGKAIDKIQGNIRIVTGKKTSGIARAFTKDGWGSGYDDVEITKGNGQWEGWGTSLKPSNEPICLARKPISEKTIAENVLKWGTGGLNIDGCRIETDDYIGRKGNPNDLGVGILAQYDGRKTLPKSKIINNEGNNLGRFPSNVLLDLHASRLLDDQTGMVKQGHWSKTTIKGFGKKNGGTSNYDGVGRKENVKGGASKFFYVPKITTKERNLGLVEGNYTNSHPTVKPITLMSYLVRLITPKGGTVLDPFMGSGSGGISTLLEGFKFIGMDQDPEYFEIATARIKEYESYREILTKPKKSKREIVIVEKDLELGEPVSTFWLNQAI